MRPAVAAGILGGCLAFAQAVSPSFEAASLRPSEHPAGRDARGAFAVTPTSIRAHNVSLKDLIVEAWRIEPWQISGAPRWIDADEFDIEAKTSAPAAPDQIAAMLRSLVVARFHLQTHRRETGMKGYALVLSKNGSKNGARMQRITSGAGDVNIPSSGRGAFRCGMRRLAAFLAVQLSIPPPADPSRPSFAEDQPVPVADRTGLDGVYEFHLEPAPELGGDTFTTWQRALGEQLGLRLESQRITVEQLVIDHVDRRPTAND